MRRLLIVLALAAFVSWQMWPATAERSSQVTDPNDGDGDGFSDAYEFTYIGTSPMSKCEPEDYLPGRVGAWPPDFNNDRFVDIYDLGAIGGRFGLVIEYWDVESRRYDIANEPMGDAAIDIADMGEVAGRFGTSCTS